MRATATCPASCGELIQGIIKDREMLISYPVDLFTKVTIAVDEPTASKGSYPKIMAALMGLLEELEESSIGEERLSISVESPIPVGKGMASSTADIASGLLALSQLLGVKLSTADLAKLALAVEPTDSTIFEKLTLFDHLKGEYIKELCEVPKLPIIVLEGVGQIDTVEVRKDSGYKSRVLSRQAAFELVETGIKQKDMRLLGMAATESARLNQRLLERPYLEKLIELSDKHRGLGLNIAHSGTVCGVICDSSTDIEKLLYELKQSFKKVFPRIYPLETVRGGPSIMDMRRI